MNAESKLYKKQTVSNLMKIYWQTLDSNMINLLKYSFIWS